ncbi:MAG: putative selenate reductase subunit YgfK, partial [Chloroflexi bacterium]|nr:putative selenate reductase subunit YgfK [Chloroflexota bacterium]
LPQLSCRQGKLAVTGEETFIIKQARQIIHVDDLCNECGNCATFCVHQGKPYLEKPRLFLERSDFEQQEDNAFYVAGSTIRRREGGRESLLSLNSGAMTFENAKVKLALSPDFEVKSMELKEEFQGTLSLVGAAEMAVILEGISRSLPFLPYE